MNAWCSRAVPIFPSHGLNFAPVALFVYNRPEHTQKTLDSLRRNELAAQSDLFVFSDAPKNKAAVSGVQKVRQLISSIEGFKSVLVITREKNLGLANSVIDGVTQICGTVGRIIVVEDDLLTGSDFLTFMNCALERYANDPRIFSASGFNFALESPNDYRYDAFCSYRSSSWGWATWVDRWEAADWAVEDYEAFRVDKHRRRLFNRGGEDLSRMLDLQMTGQIDSWAIRWAYTHFRCGGLALLSIQPKVYNIGLDGSGVHSRPGAARQSELAPAGTAEYLFPDALEPDPRMAAEIRKMCRSSLPKKLVRQFLDKLRANRQVVKQS